MIQFHTQHPTLVWVGRVLKDHLVPCPSATRPSCSEAHPYMQNNIKYWWWISKNEKSWVIFCWKHLKKLPQKNTDSVNYLLHSTALVNHTLMNLLAQHASKNTCFRWSTFRFFPVIIINHRKKTSSQHNRFWLKNTVLSMELHTENRTPVKLQDT